MNSSDFIKHDLRASLIVFLVALPLCLGVALASGAPLFSGILAGIIGGIVVGFLSGSPLSVSGPAAGLTSVVYLAISSLGSFQSFLFCVTLAGLLQIAFGFLKAGSIGNFFPASVVRGMLTAIGIILILKQIPHAAGYDVDFEGDETFLQGDGQNTLTEILRSLSSVQPTAILIGLISIGILFLWQRPLFSKNKILAAIPPSLLVVVLSVALNVSFGHFLPEFALEERHLVAVPDFSQMKGWSGMFQFPDFSLWQDSRIYLTAITLALVASLETLLSIEAADKIDPYRRITPLNRELKAQGVANTLSGLLGGLPVTSVVVRTTVNANGGAKTKAAAMMHGFLLLFCVLLIPGVLRMIPLACLAGLLIYTGYKLAKPDLWKAMYAKGKSQFLPFLVTVLAVVFLDLLQGVFCGLLVAVFYILKTNYSQSIILVNQGKSYLLKFNKDVSFLNKSTLRNLLLRIPNGSAVVIDGSDSQFVDHDIKETIIDYLASSKANQIAVELKNISLH